MGRIGDYVATLTPDERDRFKDLIDECLARETAIRANAARAQEALARLSVQHARMLTSIRSIEQTGQRLKERVGELYLKTMPRPRTLH